MHAIARWLVPVVLFAALSGCVRRGVLPPRGDEAAPSEEPPPGMVNVTFVPEQPGQTWDVFSGGQVVCTAPCAAQVNSWETLLLKSRGGDRAWLEGVGAEHPGLQRAIVVAAPERHGEHVTGITFTMLGGMGLVAGITLTAVGCSDTAKRGGACTAGLITGGITGALTAVSIWMIVDSLPKAHVLPVVRTQPVAGQPPVTLLLTPTGVVGTF